MSSILVVDDSIPAVQGILKVIDWATVGINTVHHAYSVQEAMEVLKAHHIDILLTDIEMPDGTGFDLITWCREQRMDCVSIILSSYPNFHYAQRAISLAVYEYLLKPVDDDALFLTLKRAVQHRLERVAPQSVQEEEPPENPIIAQARQYIQEHISEDITRGDIANHVGLSPEYLSTYFRKETDMTLFDYIKLERVEFAKRLLQHTNLPISMISGNVGYDSLSYFSQVFKQVTGKSPREYRLAERG